MPLVPFSRYAFVAKAAARLQHIEAEKLVAVQVAWASAPDQRLAQFISASETISPQRGQRHLFFFCRRREGCSCMACPRFGEIPPLSAQRAPSRLPIAHSNIGLAACPLAGARPNGIGRREPCIGRPRHQLQRSLVTILSGTTFQKRRLVQRNAERSSERVVEDRVADVLLSKSAGRWVSRCR